MDHLMKLDGVSTVAVMTLFAFAIERVSSAVVFLFTSMGVVQDPTEAGEKSQASAERKVKWVFFVCSAILVAGVLVNFPSLLVLTILGADPRAISPLLNYALTAIVLLGGADRVSALVSEPSGKSLAPPPEVTPLEISGRITLDGGGPRT
jgi:hypothetical protein